MVHSESIQLTQAMVRHIAELDEFKGAWRAFGKLAPEQLYRLRKIATIESVGSSTRIEGSALSDRAVEALLSGVGKQSFITRDEQEVAGYAEAMKTIFASFEHIPFDENHIKQMHAMLLQHSEKDVRHRGSYKKMSNSIQAFDQNGQSLGVIFETATPFDTPRKMGELCAWVNDALATKSVHPLQVTAVMAVVFLAIHPFQDGNGRLSRLLTTLLLLKTGYAYVPYSSLEAIIEQNKDSYYLALRRTQGTLQKDAPDWTPWIMFFLQSMQKQKQRLEEKLERERLLRGLPELSIKIMEIVAEEGEIAVRELVELIGAPRATLKKRLNELVEAGHISKMGKGRSVRYVIKAL